MDDAEVENRTADPPAVVSRRRTGGWTTGTDTAGMLVLTIVSFGVGCVVNLLRAQPLPWVYENRAQALDRAVARLEDNRSAYAPDEVPQEIRLDAFQSFVTERKGLVLDARPAVFYHEAHVPGALSLPRETFVESYDALRAMLEASRRGPTAIYCSGADCPDSQLLSDALTKLGYRRLLIYTSGWEEWSQTGLPQEGASATP